jgi:hypothetical protein
MPSGGNVAPHFLSAFLFCDVTSFFPCMPNIVICHEVMQQVGPPQSLDHAVCTFSTQTWEPNKHYFFIKLASWLFCESSE